MRIAHIIPCSNKSVIEDYIKFVNENYNIKNHTFYLINNKISDLEVLKYNNVHEIFMLKTNNIINITNNYDKLIIHFLKLKTSQMLILLLNPKIFMNIYWVAWGADLYQYKEKKEGNLLEKIKIEVKNYISTKFRKKIRYFVGIFPPDIDFFRKELHSDAKTFYASYTGNLYNAVYKKNHRIKMLENKISNNECINIQIGHSSTNVLNHISVLNNLSKFKDENINIFIPLSYGNKDYGDLVQNTAKALYGDKVVCIREIMSMDMYMEFLSTIDIAIFNTPRQIGLGNINPLLFMEKKIFMPKGSVMYDFYKSQNINICDYNEIQNLNFKDFINPINMKEGRNYMVAELDKEKKIEMWSKVFLEPVKLR